MLFNLLIFYEMELKMEYRPIDIARKLNISTSTLRVYEDMGIIFLPFSMMKKIQKT